ncbi:MAG: hypothetical protein JNL04_19745 [Rhodospirillaceae bacterium]|nr:hypothetical protein [Rhodospirillaceae bacterium]
MAPQDFPPSPKDPKTKLLKGRWVVSAAELDDAEADSPRSDRAHALREKAEEVRKAAVGMIDDGARRSLTGVAEQFERLAESIGRLQERSAAAYDD